MSSLYEDIIQKKLNEKQTLNSSVDQIKIRNKDIQQQFVYIYEQSLKKWGDLILGSFSRTQNNEKNYFYRIPENDQNYINEKTIKTNNIYNIMINKTYMYDVYADNGIRSTPNFCGQMNRQTLHDISNEFNTIYYSEENDSKKIKELNAHIENILVHEKKEIEKDDFIGINDEYQKIYNMLKDKIDTKKTKTNENKSMTSIDTTLAPEPETKIKIDDPTTDRNDMNRTLEKYIITGLKNETLKKEYFVTNEKTPENLKQTRVQTMVRVPEKINYSDLRIEQTPGSNEYIEKNTYINISTPELDLISENFHNKYYEATEITNKDKKLESIKNRLDLETNEYKIHRNSDIESIMKENDFNDLDQIRKLLDDSQHYGLQPKSFDNQTIHNIQKLDNISQNIKSFNENIETSDSANTVDEQKSI